MLAIAGGKGGCGKTTTAAALARGLAARNHDPIAVDADVDGPDLHVVAGASSAPARSRARSPMAALARGEGPAAVVETDHDLAGVGLIPGVGADEAVVARALVRLRDVGRPVVVDTPAGGARTVARPLGIADAVLLVSTPTRRSLVDAAKTAAMACALDTPVIGIVVTRSDGRLDASPLVDCPTVGHVPPLSAPLRDRRARKAYERITRCVTRHNI